MRKIKNWFLHNPALKIVSLLLAFLIWLIVVNYSNPKIKSSVTIPFDILNEKAVSNAGQIYTLNTSEVKVEFNVRSKQKNLISSSAFTAYIDLEDYSITGAVPVYLEIDSGISDLITDVSVEPAVVHVMTERIQQKRFAVKPNVTGTVAEGYVAGEISLTPEYIYVKGPVSVMGQISGVCIDVDISGTSSEVTGLSTVYFTDANGNALSGIEDSLSFAGDISYTMPVYRIKSLSVNAFPGGAPASGYTVDSVETSPTFLSVYGPEEELNKYSYILISGNELNISGISENKTFTIDPLKYLPEELKPVALNPEITVLVKVKNIHDQTAAETVQETRTAYGPNTENSRPSAEPEPEGTVSISATESVTESTETAAPAENVPAVEETLPEYTEEAAAEESTTVSKTESGSSGMEESLAS